MKIEEIFDKVYGNLPIAVACNKIDSGIFIKINEKFCEMTGYSREEIIGHSSRDFGLWKNPKQRDKLDKDLQEKRKIENVEFMLVTKSGETRHGLFSAEIITDGRFLSFAVDITQATKNAEKETNKYKTLFDNMPSGYNYHQMIYDDSGKPIDYVFLEQNNASIQLVGENYIGKTYKEWLGDVVEPFDFVGVYEKVISTGKSIKFDQYVEKLGRWYSILAYTPKKEHFAVMFDDITEMKQLEEQVRQSAKLEAVGLLAGGVAHDFNNILTIIGGHTELLNKKIIKSEHHIIAEPIKELCDYAKRKLKTVNGAVDRATKLTKQLLAFSRKQIMSPETININEFVVKERDLLRKLIREDIDILLFLEPIIGNIFIDETQLGLVFMNLMINSKDAIQSTGKITIETKNVSFDDTSSKKKQIIEAKGDYVMIAFVDDGIGMSKETQNRIFEPFFTTKELGKGVGLGLSTVYGIVKQSGGFIWVYSELGEGTTIKIYLPKVEKQINNNLNKRVEPKDFSGTETILVVEDEKDVRDLVVETLRDFGYKVLSASNGIEATEMARSYNKRIDLLFTDVVMPKMDGRELAVQLSSFLPELKVLYMSGYTDNTIVHRGILDPGTNFIQKPITANSLAEKVRGVLDNGT